MSPIQHYTRHIDKLTDSMNLAGAMGVDWVVH